MKQVSGSPALRRLALIVALVIVPLAACKPVDNPVGDGLTAVNAGASCWGIKQAFPSSSDGIYWLLTSTLDRPTQFYCDMTTSGGGWALIARGRDSWSFKPGGQGTPGAIRNTPAGTAAFNAAALSPDLINGLLNGAAVSSLPDGIRVKRSTSSDGSTSQDLRLFAPFSEWTWAFPQGQRLTSMAIDGTNYANGNTKDTYSKFYDYPTSGLQGVNSSRRLRTDAVVGNNWRQGFGFGSSVSGSTSSTTYLWRGDSSGFTLPFTQVWIRPQIANNAITFPDLPPAGFSPQAKAASLKNNTEFAPFGVVGINHAGEETIEPWNTTVNVLKAYGDRVFVGGRFTGVQQGPSASAVAQQSLAAFDLDGNWISSFNPVIDGRVWDMTMTENGKLIIGGDFSSVDGQPNTAGLAALDPITGEVIAGWHANVTHTSERANVRALDSRGGFIYAAGKFNRVQGGTWNTITVSSAISLNTDDGSPGTWKPILSGTAVRVRAAAAGDRVYLAGYFNAINGDPNHGYYGITSAATGTPVSGIGPWQPSGGSTAKYQQAVAESGSEILVGGSEHDTQIYNHDRTTLIDSNITKQGGDTQALEVYGNDIYMACHCDDTIFQGTNNWKSPAGFRSVNPINLVARLDATTHQVDTTWLPAGLKGNVGDGVWSVSRDTRGCLWVGGDLIRGNSSGDPATDWIGGFGRFCPTDSNPPSTPTGLQGATVPEGVSLTWGASGDDSGAVTYDVYRNNRVIATVGGTSFIDTTPIATSLYTVRASDGSGNRSASPAPISVAGPAPILATPVAYGSTWSYLGDGTDQGSAWANPGFDASSWATGPAQFGWGTGNETTVLAAHPLTSYYRTAFSVADLTPVKTLKLGLKVNAGAVVYINGIEAGRVNMPTGTITAATPAAAYICCAEEARVKEIIVPRHLLVGGSNSLAVEVHAWSASAGRALFDLEATTRGDNGDIQPPTAPVLTASPAADAGIHVSWTPATDNTTLAGYLITRNGSFVAAVGPTETAWFDATVTPESSYTYVVQAFDTNANMQSSSALTIVAPADANLVAFASTWRWQYEPTGPLGAWTTTGYDDSLWAVGAGELGFGDIPKNTVISAGPTPRPLTSYYRHTVELPNLAAFTTVRLDLIRNSGAAVYVNGIEVARSNLPAGPLTAGTYASGPIPGAQQHVPVSYTLPTSAFVTGTNTIAVELHLNSGNQPTAGFDLALVGQP